MESVCQAFPTNPKEAEAALMELRRSEHAIEVSKTILGELLCVDGVGVG